MARFDERTAPIRALVVDDEPLARRNVTVLLRGDPDIGSIEECGSGVEAIEVIRRWKPDLVFLDVQMPECGGFDVLELLGADLPRAIIFVTAYDEYALRAFEAGALDYLLKPFDDARFGRALNRAKDKLAHYRVAVIATGQAARRQDPRADCCSWMSRTSIGSRPRATTPASMWAVTRTSSAGRCRSSSGTSARKSSSASTARSS